jgi:thymidylate synthase (FAD)
MKVKFISKTENNNGLSNEQLIVYLARVSNPKNQDNKQTSDKLINYLIDNKHWSPFEMVDYTFEIETSRAIAAQILRHKSFSFSEQSQRYMEAISIENIELRQQSETNRQSSSEIIENNRYKERISDVLNLSYTLYQDMIRNGVAKEIARFILPLATTTRLYMKGNLRSWLHYLNVRLDHHTQKEHRGIALQIAEYFEHETPIIYKSLNNFNDKKGMFIV